MAAVAIAAAVTTVAGCSTAPAGAVGNSLAIAPTRTGGAAAGFPAFQLATAWPGAGGVRYTAVTKPKSGIKTARYSITVAPGLAFWLACIPTDGASSGGSAHIASAPIGLKWSVACSTDPDPAGITFAPPPATVGETVKITVTSTAHTRWLFRADASATRPAAATPATPATSG